ncbi:response regulator transcription factor [Dasania marina]|uniref:response regulator transcription factor n=1 Tax=Dasania marina TaxID=471499 RepID=UPI0030DA7DFB|tara:strand:- start:54053 stop:54721 length:669 start_codon:yes stop_codon:yes gene_type:complete
MKILIVEDSPRLCRSLSTGFTNLGFKVDTAEDGKDGLHLALHENYDVIVLDIMLPNIDGLTILRTIRDNKINTSVLILSARDELEERIKGLNLGADDYLCKPFSFDELHARINTLVRRSHNIKSNTFNAGPLLIDIPLKRISINESEVNLTHNEYILLEVLCLNIGRVITYEGLEQHLYDRDKDVTRNAIEAHISSARKKLKKLGAENIIKTRRGFGYYIEK